MIGFLNYSIIVINKKRTIINEMSKLENRPSCLPKGRTGSVRVEDSAFKFVTQLKYYCYRFNMFREYYNNQDPLFNINS